MTLAGKDVLAIVSAKQTTVFVMSGADGNLVGQRATRYIGVFPS